MKANIGAFQLVALILGYLVSGAAAGADAGDSYKKGLAAIEEGAWAQAVGLLEESIAARPKARAGRLRGPYLPYFYLGIAHAELDECADALVAWKTSVEQGMVEKHADLLARLQDRRQLCVTRLEVVAAAKQAEQELQRVSALEVEVAELAASIPGAWAAGTPPLRERLADAGETAAAGRADLASPSGSLSREDTERARAAAAESMKALSSLREELVELRSRHREERRAALEELEQAAELVKGAMQGTGGPSSLADLVRAAEDAKAGASLDEIQRLRRRLTAAIAQLTRGIPAQPPPSLLEAAEAFFAGEYQRALEILEVESYSEQEPRVQAALFQAGASFGLYLLDGERDEALLETATGAVLDCRQIDPSAGPDPEAFSPRFVEFFHSLGEP